MERAATFQRAAAEGDKTGRRAISLVLLKGHLLSSFSLNKQNQQTCWLTTPGGNGLRPYCTTFFLCTIFRLHIANFLKPASRDCLVID